MNQMEIFKNPEFGSIRTLEHDGKVLFCGTDIAAALGYTNPRKAVRDHTRGGTKCSIPTNSGNQTMTFISEGDVYFPMQSPPTMACSVSKTTATTDTSVPICW